MSQIQERGSTHVYKVNKISKEEMESMVTRCVYEEAPFCSAACPLKLDVRAMLKAAAAGDFKKALQLYEKAAPFPLIVSAGCEAPCEKKCRLSERGDGIAVREIEAAVSRCGKQSRLGSIFRTKKKKTAAILGSGLFPLFLAGELEKKAYPVTVFCEQENPEDFLRCAAGFLDDEAFRMELGRLKGKDIQFSFGCRIDAAFLEEKRRSFDMVCVSESILDALLPDSTVIPELMYCEEEKLIACRGEGVMAAAVGAKKAALTADRLAQNLDPRSMRGTEDPFESRLYTDLDEAKALTRVPKSGDRYTEAEAAEEARRCIQCHCEECMKSCAYLEHYKKYPGLLAREIYNNTQIIMGDHQLNKPMNACTLCGQCTAVCPNGFDMARVCASARRNMVSTDKMPLAPHEFALMDMLFSNGDAFLSRPQPGKEQCRFVFFPGCQAICDWAGRYEMQDSTRAFLLSELSKLGDPVIIAGCPTCRKELSELTGREVKGIWEILDEIGLPDGAKGMDRPAALHDACGARGDARTQETVRRLAEKLGVTLTETPYSGDRAPCCGYGGLTAYANPEVADEITQKALSRSDAPYVSYCMACRDRFARQGRESRHLLELVYGTDAGSPPDISEKRWNRLTLKNELLQELWLEEPKEMKLDYELNYTDEARKLMDGRMILTDDVIAVLDAFRENGEAIEDEDGLLVARHRVGNATFWVKFSMAGDNGYLVHRAWSHRMNVVKREG